MRKKEGGGKRERTDHTLAVWWFIPNSLSLKSSSLQTREWLVKPKELGSQWSQNRLRGKSQSYQNTQLKDTDCWHRNEKIILIGQIQCLPFCYDDSFKIDQSMTDVTSPVPATWHIICGCAGMLNFCLFLLQQTNVYYCKLIYTWILKQLTLLSITLLAVYHTLDSQHVHHHHHLICRTLLDTCLAFNQYCTFFWSPYRTKCHGDQIF